MNGLYAAAIEIQQFCEARGWRFCIIGGLALVRWADPRQTLDVDLTLLTSFEGEPAVITSLVSAFRPRRPDAQAFAQISRVVLIEASNGVPLDVSLGGLPFEERMMERATYFEYLPKVSLVTASAEDMVVLKSFAGRPKDWLDVEAIVTRQARRLDWRIILEELTPLCELKESPESVAALLEIRSRLGVG